MAQSEDEHKVEVYIYDLSKGMATALSMPLLGKQIDGIWHTAIVVFGMEYYFGANGISYCEPAQTIIGQPDTIKNLGTTSISCDVFTDFLYGLSNDQFKPERYNLFDHNCNTFSNEVAQFLTGNKIPSYIIDLPAEVANTPLGSMMKSMSNSIAVQPSGGKTLFSSSSSSSSSPSPQLQYNSLAWNSAPKNTNSNSATFSPVTYPSSEPFPDSDTFSTILNETEKKLLEDIYKCLSSSSSHNIGKAHLKMLASLVTRKSVTNSIIKCGAVSLLQELISKRHIVQELQKDDDHMIASLLLESRILPFEIMVAILKLVTNLCSSEAGLHFLTSTVEHQLDSAKVPLSSSNGSSTTFSYLALTGEAVVNGLLLEQSDINDVAAAAVYNIHQIQMHDDLLIAVSSALTQCLQREEILEKTAFLGLQSLKWFIKLNEGVCALVKMMELNYQSLSQKSSRVKETCEQINNILRQLND
ncbi:uncharacterized protein LOC106877851 [Octopus bimaculoides]|uniref:PPPDE domain-containing protein n=1 Tax=Octopus bimaculoides TaxID=37653 RepID=A0A0L8GC47_OCTBM|nr:uncharacterized protein LOC106877851 [Octopus bimaculoides]|eukprot:XP_014782370.1 PREDICTED: uncharacterized protein LOC106877851 [Octopus bimaculoides]